MAGWHHRLDGHGFGWTLGVGDGQGGLACCDSWGGRELDMTEPLNCRVGNSTWYVATFWPPGKKACPRNNRPALRDDKYSTCNAGDLGSTSGSGRSLEKE